MDTLTVHPVNKKQLTVLEALFKEMKIPFEKGRKKPITHYNEEFEAKMKRSAEDKKAGRYRVIKTADLWK